MEVLDLSWNTYLLNRHNNPLLPRSIRGLIIGKSGSGKTCLLINFLLQPTWLDYNDLKVFGKSLFQSEYKIIKTGIEQKIPKEDLIELFKMRDKIIPKFTDPTAILESLGKEITTKSDITCEFYETAKDVPDPAALDKNHKNLMIFDDLQLEKQNKCEDYYVRGRHSNVDCFYLAQNYFNLPRRTIRENANFMCIFQQDTKNINHLYNDHASTDMSKQQFRDLCKRAWSTPHGFLTIDLTSNKSNGKYRIGLDLFYIL